tara:strand:- start:503046 stop:504800 length:1755 start_codon:yes stop_codon:yes gene_type:complete
VIQDLRAAFTRAAQVRLGLSFRDVQAAAAKHLLHRRIAEMQTGEGKTLTTAFAAAAHARAGRHVFVATANAYLANRDAAWMRPVFEDLDVTVGSACTGTCTREAAQQSAQKATGNQVSYQANITYGTIRQFGFDFLRDSIRRRQQAGVTQALEARDRLSKPLDVLIVDEADSVLIDEARTPMIITAAGDGLCDGEQALFRWAADVARILTPGPDCLPLDSQNAYALTSAGRRRALDRPMPPAMNRFSTTEILHAVERAVLVQHEYHRDHQYLVRNQQVDVVDEYTGRASTQRTMSGGVHQAVEAKEGLPLSPVTKSIARITVQDFVAKFDHVCGLTATAHEDRHELAAVYRLRVKRIPTFRPVQRASLPTVVCASRAEKWNQISTEIAELAVAGRPVLVGTRTIEQSESLGEVLQEHGIEHQLLNAKNPEQEAVIIAQAGRSGCVTIATNMAGRGTDIPITDDVRARGGLHVIVSEMHAAHRIDQQLMGRCGRQGDPGSTRLFVSAEDELLALAWGKDIANQIKIKFDARRNKRWLIRQFVRAQQHLARLYRQQREQLTQVESRMAESMRLLGLDPHLDPIADD